MTGGTFRAELQHVPASEDGRAAGVPETTAERDGRRLDDTCCLLFEIRDGRVLSGRQSFYDLHRWDAFRA
jgi:ketosteroid isomerase-like protein